MVFDGCMHSCLHVYLNRKCWNYYYSEFSDYRCPRTVICSSALKKKKKISIDEKREQVLKFDKLGVSYSVNLHVHEHYTFFK